MNFLKKNSADVRPMRPRHYDISTDRDTAEIRGRLLRRIRARLRSAALPLFNFDATEVVESRQTAAWQCLHGD
jgi:hypothetical protein